MSSVMITGAGSGLGRELALGFAKQGYHIILLGRNRNKLEVVKKQIHDVNGSADSFILDLTDNGEIKRLVTELAAVYSISILINNAGVGYFGPFEKMPDTEWREMIDTNIIGTIQLTQAVLPCLERQENSAIIQIISTAGLRGKKHEAVYCASKFAIRGFTESLQKEYDDTAVSITGVYMGGMDTPFWDYSDHVKDKSRFRTAKEVAQLIIDGYQKEKEIIIESLT
ncbi:SDR family oxidoreductase [Bacillus sp. V59.32b]|uniref:SDR family NAD(P)-dependent oxidoreductase n=1 Tax=Bacillus sp. V59.32b TaxID=1758642 RepID=UPI000E3EB8D8|nr:SDR family oxidoreductase [Bacillus sp. V59.32b]RFU69407.1 SDR family oxidoreductase [Bacillus sp. V59.32b]